MVPKQILFFLSLAQDNLLTPQFDTEYGIEERGSSDTVSNVQNLDYINYPLGLSFLFLKNDLEGTHQL